MGRRTVHRPQMPKLLVKKPEDAMNAALNNLYMNGKPNPKGGRTGSR